MSDSDIISKAKELMPYLIAAVVLACLTALRCVNQIAEDRFWQVFMLIIGYVFADVTSQVQLWRTKKMLKKMELPE